MSLRIIAFIFFIFTSNTSLANWVIEKETKLPTVFSHDGSGYSHANIFKPRNGIAQVYIWVKPKDSHYCRAQGEANGDFGYIVKSKVIVNDTLIYMKKFIEPTKNGCYVYFAGDSIEDKKALISEFMKSSDVFVEIDGADLNVASKYRGEQIMIPGVVGLDGRMPSFQIIKDTFGKEHNFFTVPSSEVRWYRYKTKNFNSLWIVANNSKE